MNVNKIKGLMAERSQTQDDLAKILKISRNSVQLKLSGKSEFKANEIATLAKLYNVDINYFFS